MKNTNTVLHKGESGNALLIVMMAMILIMGISGALVDHFITAEADAIAENLAKIRIHWAIRGQLDMPISRARNSPGYNGNSTNLDGPLSNTSSKSYRIANYLNSAVTSSSLGGTTIMQPRGTDSNGYPLNRWYYPERVPGNNYVFDIATKVLDNNATNCGDTFGSQTTSDGRLCMQFEVRDPTTNSADPVIPVPILQRVVNRRIAMRADICVGNLATGTRAVGVACTVVSGNVAQDPGGDRYITTIERFGIVRP